MFLTTEAVPFFDYLRIPYRIDGGGSAGLPDGFGAASLELNRDRRMMWPAESGDLVARAGIHGEYELGGSPLFAHLVPDDEMKSALGPGWHSAEAVRGRDDRMAASVWRDANGSVCLPFDPGQALLAFWSEGYQRITSGRHAQGPSRALRLYYRLRPIVPRRVQIALRRQYARRSTRGGFPRWPVEPALHDLLRNLYGVAEEVAGEPPPWIAPWPAPYEWAIVLTHDVEGMDGYRRIGDLLALETELGFRSAWYFVPRRYTVQAETLRQIEGAGGEIGLHGLFHDGRDLASPKLLESRLPEMRRHAARYGAIGFRSPATQRQWELMPMLGFDYDSSYSDTDPYEPQPGGSCAWLPYAIGEMVELPITLAQDHTLFVILSHTDAGVWLDKAALLRERGGMALMLTHPDYLGDETARSAYREVLEAHADDATAWRALPREVSAWWRRRASSDVVRDGDAWRVRGPAEGEATVVRASPR